MKDGRPQEAICRYDLQENVHTNPDGTLTLLGSHIAIFTRLIQSEILVYGINMRNRYN